MTILVAGSHGTTGQHIVEKLAAREHAVKAMIRDEGQADTLRALGGDPVVADLTEDVAYAVDGCDAVIFAAGSGGKDLEAVDKGGAINLIDASVAHGVDRFVMLSSISADEPEEGPEQLRPYLRAKHAADEHLRRSGLTYTIVQPGALTDEAERGTITAAEDIGHRDGSIPRADVAEAIVVALETPNTQGRTVELLSGDVSVPEALRAF